MRFPRQRKVRHDDTENQAKEVRLEDAEKRANALFETAEWLRTVVTRRDQENHWQAAVNQLFLGGKP